MKFIGYKNPEPTGDISVDLILLAIDEEAGQTIEQILNAVDPSLNPKVIDETELPGPLRDLPFWDYDGQTSIYNIEKLRAAVKNRLRGERQRLLEQLDVEFMKALEQGLDTSTIVAEKQRLRDITSIADNVHTVEELKQLKIPQ